MVDSCLLLLLLLRACEIPLLLLPHQRQGNDRLALMAGWLSAVILHSLHGCRCSRVFCAMLSTYISLVTLNRSRNTKRTNS